MICVRADLGRVWGFRCQRNGRRMFAIKMNSNTSLSVSVGMNYLLADEVGVGLFFVAGLSCLAFPVCVHIC